MITKNPKDTGDPIITRRTIDTREKGAIWMDAVICTLAALRSWIPLKPRLSNTVCSELSVNLDDLKSENETPIISVEEGNGDETFSHAATTTKDLFIYLPETEKITEGLNAQPLINELEYLLIKIAREFGVEKIEVFYNPPPAGDDLREFAEYEAAKYKFASACSICNLPCDLIDGFFKPTCDCEKQAEEISKRLRKNPGPKGPVGSPGKHHP